MNVEIHVETNLEQNNGHELNYWSCVESDFDVNGGPLLNEMITFFADEKIAQKHVIPLINITS